MSLRQAVTTSATAPLRSTPTVHRKRSLGAVRGWLWAVAGCIFLMVVVGGATRLTQSGLSITEWKPVMGVVPPLSQDAWQAEFDKYRAIPQYAQLFPDMDLAGFKSIFYWEWAHRLLGRCIGIVMAVPLVGFWITGRLTPRLKPQLVGPVRAGRPSGADRLVHGQVGPERADRSIAILPGPASRDGLAHLRVVDLARRRFARRSGDPGHAARPIACAAPRP